MIKDLIIYTPMYVTFFWAIILFSATLNNKAKKFLGVFMVFAFLVYLSHALYFKQYEETYILFDSVYILSSLSVYPLYFWYIKLLTIEPRYNFKNFKLLIPAAVLSVSTAVIYLFMQPNERLAYLHGFLQGGDTDLPATALIQLQKIVFYVSRVVFAAQVIFFLFKGRKLVIRYNTGVANFYSNLESKTLVWVNRLLYSFVATSLMSIIFNVLGRHVFLESAFLLFIPSVIFSVLLFFIGFEGYMQNHTVEDLVKDEKKQPEKNLNDYSHSQLKEQILDLFTNKKIYRNTDLKITQISAQLRTNRTYVSNLINSEFSSSFSEFVNEFRIEEAKQMLLNDELQNYSLNYISEAVGFGSLNTFIRVFKESQGTTPGNYRIRNKETL